MLIDYPGPPLSDVYVFNFANGQSLAVSAYTPVPYRTVISDHEDWQLYANGSGWVFDYQTLDQHGLYYAPGMVPAMDSGAWVQTQVNNEVDYGAIVGVSLPEPGLLFAVLIILCGWFCMRRRFCF